MDYLSLLPVELWSRIIEVAVDLGTHWPPPDALTFLLLDRTYGQPGDYTYDVKGRYHFRLVCSSFKKLVDRYVSTQPSVTRSNPSTRLSDRLLGTSVTTLIVCLGAYTPNGLSDEQIIRNLWNNGPSLPSLRVLTLDKLSGSHDLWGPLSKAFPQLESLALRPTSCAIVNSDGLGTVTLKRLQHLYMPRVISTDLPVLPNLKMVRMGTVTTWDVYERTPSLETVSLSDGMMVAQAFMFHPRIRHLECNALNTFTYDIWGTDYSANLELLIFTAHISEAAIITEIVVAARNYRPKSMHLNFTGAHGHDELVDACAERGVFFDQTYLPVHDVGSPRPMIDQGKPRWDARGSVTGDRAQKLFDIVKALGDKLRRYFRRAGTRR